MTEETPDVVHEHGPDCPCTRCVGFVPGHELSVNHGAYATVRLGDRALELADEMRALVVAFRESDEPAVRLLGLTFARVEAFAAAAEKESDPVRLARLEQDARGWVNTAVKLLKELGMTPAARMRLGVDIAVAHRVATLTAMAKDESRAEGGSS